MSLGDFRFGGNFDPTLTPAEVNAIRRGIADQEERVRRGTDAATNDALATQQAVREAQARAIYAYMGYDYDLANSTERQTTGDHNPSLQLWLHPSYYRPDEPDPGVRFCDDDSYRPPYPIPNSVLVAVLGEWARNDSPGYPE